MDVFLASKLLNKNQKELFKKDRKEKEEVVVDVDVNKAFFGFTFFIILLLLLSLLGIPAAYLSWTSNTVVGWNFAFKLLFAIVAFFNGLSYLLTHLICKLDLLHALNKASTYSATPSYLGGRRR